MALRCLSFNWVLCCVVGFASYFECWGFGVLCFFLVSFVRIWCLVLSMGFVEVRLLAGFGFELEALLVWVLGWFWVCLICCFDDSWLRFRGLVLLCCLVGFF